MKEKTLIEKANDNIEILINQIIFMEKDTRQGLCVGLPKEYNSCDNIDCGTCKNIYYSRKRERLLKEFCIYE